MTKNNQKTPLPKNLWITYQVLAALLAILTAWVVIKNIPFFYHARWENWYYYYCGPMFCQFFFLLACLPAILRRKWSLHLVFVTGIWFLTNEGYNLVQDSENMLRGWFITDQVETWRLALGYLLLFFEIILIIILIILSYKIKNHLSDDKSTAYRPAFTVNCLKKDLILKISIAIFGLHFFHYWLSSKSSVNFYNQTHFIELSVSFILLASAVVLLLLYHYLYADAPYATASLGVSGILCILVVIPLVYQTIYWTSILVWIPPIILGILALRSRQGSLLLRITALALPLLMVLTQHSINLIGF